MVAWSFCLAVLDGIARLIQIAVISYGLINHPSSTNLALALAVQLCHKQYAKQKQKKPQLCLLSSPMIPSLLTVKVPILHSSLLMVKVIP